MKMNKFSIPYPIHGSIEVAILGFQKGSLSWEQGHFLLRDARGTSHAYLWRLIKGEVDGCRWLMHLVIENLGLVTLANKKIHSKCKGLQNSSFLHLVCVFQIAWRILCIGLWKKQQLFEFCLYHNYKIHARKVKTRILLKLELWETKQISSK